MTVLTKITEGHESIAVSYQGKLYSFPRARVRESYGSVESFQDSILESLRGGAPFMAVDDELVGDFKPIGEGEEL